MRLLSLKTTKVIKTTLPDVACFRRFFPWNGRDKFTHTYLDLNSLRDEHGVEIRGQNIKAFDFGTSLGSNLWGRRND